MEANGREIVRIGHLELRFVVSDAGATVFEFIVPSHARVPAPDSRAESRGNNEGFRSRGGSPADDTITRMP